jgi:hypothetical protein
MSPMSLVSVVRTHSFAPLGEAMPPPNPELVVRGITEHQKNDQPPMKIVRCSGSVHSTSSDD